MCLQVCVCMCVMTDLAQSDGAYSSSSVASHSRQLLQQAVDRARHLSPKLWHHLKYDSQIL